MKGKEDFCVTCGLAAAALIGGTSAGAGALTSEEEEKNKKRKKWLIIGGISISVLSLIIYLIIRQKGGCKSCQLP